MLKNQLRKDAAQAISYRKLALASVAAIPFYAGLAASPAQAQIVNTATVNGTPDSGTLTPATATESVTVALPIDAVNDTVSDINGTIGATGVLNVLSDDTLDASAATTGNVTISEVTPATPQSAGALVPVLNTTTGAIDVPAGTPPGTYQIEYQICETANSGNCDTAIATVNVVLTQISADDDSATGIDGAAGATGVVDAIDGDLLDNAQTSVGDVIVSVVTPATPASAGAPVPTLNTATGQVDVPAGTPAGTYTIDYRICESADTDNCADATITIEVASAAITAVDDAANIADGLPGVADVLNVFDNDTLNGAAATAANTTLSVAGGSSVPAELTFDPADGSVDVNAGTLAGTYSFDYQICETLNPTNCATATATVTVDANPELSMVKEADDTEFVTVGQVITYTYTVTNSGNVVIRGVSITDTHNAAGAAPTPSNPQLLQDNGTAGDSTDGDPGDDQWDVLSPGDVIRFTGTYTVQQADIDNLQ